MQKTRPRILSLLLALVMCLGLLPMTAMAAGGGSGEPALSLDPDQQGEFGLREDPEVFVVPLTIIPPSGDSWYEIKVPENNGDPIYETQPTPSDSPAPRDTQYKLAVTLKRPDGTSYTTSDQYPAGTSVSLRESGGGKVVYRAVSGTGSAASNPSSFVLTADSTLLLEASYADIDINITYDYNGAGQTVTRQVKYQKAIDLPDVSMPGYRFLGWYTGTPEKPYLKDYSRFSGGTATRDITLYAMWEKAPTYTVTFDWNGAFINPITESVKSGDRINGYALTKPYGGIHSVVGWATKDGTAWDFHKGVTQDMTLYAVWEPKIETISPAVEDTFRFNNGDSYFSGYRISDTYYKYLTKNEPLPFVAKINALYNAESWIGSCFGMSAVYCMGRANQIGLSTFQSGANRLWDLSAPNRSQNIQDLINFYMLAQCTLSSYNYSLKYYYTDPMHPLTPRTIASRYEMIVNEINKEPGFSLLGFDYGVNSGHAIVARSVSMGSDGNYHIQIWDPNYPSTLGELLISSDYSRAWFGEKTLGNNVYNVNTELSYVMPVSEKSQHYDAKNLEAEVKSNAASSAQAVANVSQLFSSTGDFSVAAADGRSAVVKNGKQVSGDLPLVRNSFKAGMTDDYSFIIGAATLDGLIVTVGGKQAEVEFLSNDILAKVSANGLDSLSVQGDTVTTSCTGQAQQEITLVSDKLGNTWNKVTVSGKDTEFTLKAENNQLKVSSKNNTSVTVQGENVTSRKTSGKQTITASSNGTAVAMNNNLSTGTQQPAGNNPFTDVKEGTYYYDAVLWAAEKGITSGTKFYPNSPCTRGQIVTFLWRAAGSPKPTSTQNPFKDVKPGAFYYDAVLWAVEKGITSGSSATTFSPDVVCTRGQTVTFLYRAAGSPKIANSVNPFKDVKSGTFYHDAVLWAAEQKVTLGSSATTFSPGVTVTRGQTVTFLYRSQGK